MARVIIRADSPGVGSIVVYEDRVHIKSGGLQIFNRTEKEIPMDEIVDVQITQASRFWGPGHLQFYLTGEGQPSKQNAVAFGVNEQGQFDAARTAILNQRQVRQSSARDQQSVGYVLPAPLRHAIVNAVLRLPNITDADARTTLLFDLPAELRLGILRSDSATADVEHMLDAVCRWDTQGQALRVFLGTARESVAGAMLSTEFDQLLARLADGSALPGRDQP